MVRVVSRRNQKPVQPGVMRVRVDRTSPMGNPFKVDRQTSRQAAVDMYKQWLLRDPRANEARKAVRDLIKLDQSGHMLELECWCAPLACHADVIKHIIINARAKKGA